MTFLTLRVDGAQLVRTGLQNLSAEIPRIGREQIWLAMGRIKTRMQTYPPERPNQRYIRTYTLQAGWTIEASGSIGYRIRNQVGYTEYVVGSAYGTGQAPVHVGRWQILRDVVEEEVSSLPNDIDEHITMVARRSGL